MQQLTIEAELGELGLLFNCPYCGSTQYIPPENINENEMKLKEKSFKCEDCGKRFIVKIKQEKKEEDND